MTFKNIASSADVAKQLINGNKARPAAKTAVATIQGVPQETHDALVADLNARIATLETDLAAEKEAHEKTQAALTAATAVPNGEQTA